MICLVCDNDEFVEKPDALIKQKFKGETLEIKTAAMVCSDCGWVTMSLKQVDELRRRTSEAWALQKGTQ